MEVGSDYNVGTTTITSSSSSFTSTSIREGQHWCSTL